MKDPSQSRATAAEAVATLTAAQHSAGGWGYSAAQAGNTECTALAALALNAQRHDGAGVHAMERGLAWLRSTQHADGGWPMSEQVPDSSWMSSLAVLALASCDPGDRQAVGGARWLLGHESHTPNWLQRTTLRLFGGPRVVDQDPNLIGWPWTADTAPWVEPTAWSLLAAKLLLPHLPTDRARERIRHAELMLADRMCVGGGWNYGNKRVLGEELPPYPDTTALALMALQDSHSNAVTGASRVRLRGMIRESRSTLILALGILSLQLHGEDVATLRSDLLRRVRANGIGTEVRTMALALLALDESTIPFRLGARA